jgi:hypothetical protein
MTVNALQSCPVYCLRFDQTGLDLITGAEIFLLKVVYLVGATQMCRTQREANRNRLLRSYNYGANSRGAVSVCTLKGHAGLINDIIAVSTVTIYSTEGKKVKPKVAPRGSPPNTSSISHNRTWASSS